MTNRVDPPSPARAPTAYTACRCRRSAGPTTALPPPAGPPAPARRPSTSREICAWLFDQGGATAVFLLALILAGLLSALLVPPRPR